MTKKRLQEVRQIDADTGEILFSSQSISRFKYFDEEKGYLFWPNKQAVKMHKGFSLPDDLSDSDVARTYRLSLATHTNSNLICYRSDKSIKPMQLKVMSRYLGTSLRQTVAFVNRMIARHIIGKVKVTVGNGSEIQYYLNPIYFFNGKWLNCNLYLLFKTDLDAFLPEWVKAAFDVENNRKPQVGTLVPTN